VPATLKLALETLLVQKKYQDYGSKYQRKCVELLEERWEEAKWSASDGVADLFAQVHAALGDFDEAIKWYDAAIDVADGDVSLRALEQRTNLQVCRALDTLEKAGKGSGSSARAAAARKAIRDGVDSLGKLSTFRETAERANLCGSAMKRLALIEAAAGRSSDEVQAIKAMKDYYRRAQELCLQDKLPDLFYPALDYIAAELALSAGTKGWKLGPRSLLEATRKSLEDKNKDDPDFRSFVGATELDLYEAVGKAALADRLKSIEKSYEDAYMRMRGASGWRSVYDTARFVLGRYRERATTAEKSACKAVLEKLEAYARG
jgi:tetratricopeptide (TPR) repeat protein